MTEQDAPKSDNPVSLFVSYSRTDLAAARPVIDALIAEGFDVWWDGLLAGGDAFASTTETALETADAVVVLWSEKSIQSHWVRDEATRGRDRGRMVPVSLDGTIPPLGFRQIQYIDLSHWGAKPGAPAFAELNRAIRATAGAPHGQLTFAASATSPAPARASRRGALLLGGGLVALAGGGLAAWRAGLLGGSAKANSIAILPFRNIGGDAQEDYFSDGLAEELRTTLSLNRALEVSAETSSASAGAKDSNPRSIAGRLNVAYVLDGSVRRAGERLRIAVRLVDGSSGFETWSQSFDRVVADVFALQDEIATTVADALAVKVVKGDSGAPSRVGGTRNSAALDAYLKGRALFNLARDEASDRDALAAFEQALKLDPEYAAAAAAKSRCLTVFANNYVSGDEIKSLYSQAIDWAQRATAMAPDLAEAQSALGFGLFNGRLDVAAARAPYQRAFELGFGNADILSSFANFAGRTGNLADARKAFARAQRLDPLNAGVFRAAGIIEYAGRNFPAALTALRSALTLNPQQGGVHVTLGDIHLLGGNAGEARSEYLLEANALPRLRGLAIAERKLGNQPAADKALADMIAQFADNSLYQQGQIRTQWGQAELALDTLEKALSVGDSGLIQALTDPLLDPLRPNARFVALLKRLGFE